MTYRGGCACGAIRYAIDSAPIFSNHCQCRDCQQRSGTGHGSYLTFAHRAEARLTGAAQTWTLKGDSGDEKSHAFCPVCGAPVYLTFAAMPDLIAIHSTSLDDPCVFVPQAVTYALRAQPWDTLDPQLPAFERMPT